MMHCGYFYTAVARKGNHSSLLTSTLVGERCPFHQKFALSDPPLRKTPTSTDFRKNRNR